MKNILYALITFSVFITACSNSGNNKTNTDSTGNSIIVPPPDNNSATNPSLADTAFKNQTDSSKMRKDSMK